MKKTALVFTLAAVVLVIVLAGCGEKKETAQATPEAATPSAHAEAPVPAANPDMWQGEVLETMNSGGYTYAYFNNGTENVWVAGPATEIAVGQQIVTDKGMAMPDFHAKSLDRTFEVIYFVGSVAVAGASASASTPAQSAPAGMGTGDGGSHNVVEKTDVKDVAKVAGGYTVEEIFTQSAALSGQPVKVRGQVVKFTPNIMGTNWVHIQDGTGTGATGDLTVTTSAVVAAGDMVTVEGSLTVNKDFGAGYKYAAIIENAIITKE